jgi:hypothetical protein
MKRDVSYRRLQLIQVLFSPLSWLAIVKLCLTSPPVMSVLPRRASVHFKHTEREKKAAATGARRGGKIVNKQTAITAYKSVRQFFLV